MRPSRLDPDGGSVPLSPTAEAIRKLWLGMNKENAQESLDKARELIKGAPDDLDAKGYLSGAKTVGSVFGAE